MILISKFYFIITEKAAKLTESKDLIKRLATCYIKSQDIPQNDDKILALFDKHSRSEAIKYMNVAVIYYNIEGVANHFEKAFEWFSKAAELGETRSIFSLGYMYGEGKGIEIDDIKSFEWYLRDAELGDKPSMAKLVKIYINGNGTDKNYAEALKYLLKCGDFEYCIDEIEILVSYIIDILADSYIDEKFNTKLFEDKILEVFYDKAETANAIYRLSKIYSKVSGNILHKDCKNFSETMHTISRNKDNLMIAAAELGHAEAMYKFSEYLYNGSPMKSFEWCMKAAELGNVKAIYEVAEHYRCGYGVKEDFAEAVKWFRKAADLDDLFAINALFECYLYGEGVEQDEHIAFEWLKKYHLDDEVIAMGEMANIYYNNDRVRDKTKAFEWLLNAVKQGGASFIEHIKFDDEIEVLSEFFTKMPTDKIVEMFKNKSKAADALFGLAQICDKKFSLPEDDYEDYRPDKNAIELFKKADKLDHKYAAQRLGELYYLKCNGASFRNDFKISHKWFERAASFGIPNAMYNTGMGYYNFGEFELALEWINKAAELNYPDAFNQLGEMYYFGREGVEKNLEEAIKFFRKAADLGNTSAMFHLGDCYMHGEGVEQSEAEALKWFIKRQDGDESEGMAHLAYMYSWDSDYAKSFEWYSKAAELGNAEAVYSLGCCYEEGNGVEKDSAKALEYYLKAADKDSEDGIHAAIELYLNDENIKNIPAALKMMVDKGEYYMHEVEQIVEFFVKASEADILAMYTQDITTALEAINNLIELYKKACGEYEDDYYTKNLTVLYKKAESLEIAAKKTSI